MDWIIKNLFSILNLVVLILLSLYGKAWVNRKKANLEKEIEELKSSHSKELFIHKLQFEKEFGTYKYLWMKVAHFNRAVREFYYNPDEPKDWQHLYDNFVKEYNEVKETIINNTPFISEEVYEKTQQLIDLSLEPFFVYSKSRAVDKERLPDIVKGISSICIDIEKAIRERIKNLGKAKLVE